MMKMIPRPRFKQKKRFGLAVVSECIRCGKKLPDNNKHHLKCLDCWREDQCKKGNMTDIGGIK